MENVTDQARSGSGTLPGGVAAAVTGAGSEPTVVLVSLSADERVGQLAGALAEQGCRPLVVTRDEGPTRRFAGDGVRHRPVTAGPARTLDPVDTGHYFEEFTEGVAGIVASAKPDVVHTVGWPAGLSARWIGPGPRRVHSFRAPSGQRLGADRQRVERAALRGAERVLVDSAPARDLACRLGVPARRVSVVPVGLDLAVFRPSRVLEGRPSRPRLVLVADRPDQFPVRAVLRAVPDAELILLEVSDRPVAVDTAVNDTVKHTDDDAVRPPEPRSGGPGRRVRVVHASDPEQRAVLLRSADVLLCRDPSEDARSVPLEAMACGVPVVACCPESVDAVLPRISGIHAIRDGPEELGAAVRSLVGDPVRWQAMSSGAVDRAESRYGWARVAAETARAYQQVVAPESPVRSARGAVGATARL